MGSRFRLVTAKVSEALHLEIGRDSSMFPISIASRFRSFRFKQINLIETFGNGTSSG
jgi:hypothetical protein